MEIQFELEDETSFMNYLEYACLRCRGKIISLWIGTSQPSFISFERSSWDMSRLHLSDLRPPPDKYCWWFTNPAITSWVWHFIPVFTMGFIYPRWLFRISSINNKSKKKMQKNKAIPEKKHVELYIPKLVQNIPTVEFCWKSTKSFPNFQVKKVTQVKVYPNAPNAPGTST